MSSNLRLGIAGLGTVGVGVVKIIQNHVELLEQRCGRGVEITCVSAQSKDKDRGVDCSSYDWEDDPLAMASRDDVDVVVELIGGSDGVAADLVKAALENGKHVVTANKALMAHQGAELAVLAEDNNASLNFEASVAGGIPAIKAMREAFMGNQISGVYGILNGTCNYILTQMREEGRDFADVLKDAQDMGYAEADPEFDIEGVDAGHKICLLTALVFGVKPDFENLPMTGISHLRLVDIEFAAELGYKIKLLGQARKFDDQILQTVEPCLVPWDSPLGSVEDVFNAVFIEGDSVDKALLEGRGAGEGPTASAVMGDVIDLARGINVPTFGVAAKDLKEADFMNQGEAVSNYYVRLNVLDQPGVIADVSAILRDHQISIESLLQYGRDPGAPVHVVIKTHEVARADLEKAVAAIAELDSSEETPCFIRIADEL